MNLWSSCSFVRLFGVQAKFSFKKQQKAEVAEAANALQWQCHNADGTDATKRSARAHNARASHTETIVVHRLVGWPAGRPPQSSLVRTLVRSFVRSLVHGLISGSSGSETFDVLHLSVFKSRRFSLYVRSIVSKQRY